MTDNKQPEFQLSPKKFHIGNFLIDGFIDKLVKGLNDSDLNHDGKKDLGQALGVFNKLSPVFAVLFRIVKWDVLQKKLVDTALSHGIVPKEHEAEFTAAIGQLLSHSQEAWSLIPKQE